MKDKDKGKSCVALVVRRALSTTLALTLMLGLMPGGPLRVAAGVGDCNHVHDASCNYDPGTSCVHDAGGTHGDGSCGFVEGVACDHTHNTADCDDGNSCDHNDGDAHSTGACSFVQDSPCTHAGYHDASCGFVAESCDHVHSIACGELDAVPVSGITVSGTGGSNQIATPQGTLQMIADVLPVDASTQDVVWSVENGSAIADIDANGLLRANGSGNGPVVVRATATDGSNVYGEMTVTLSGQVTQVTGITLRGHNGVTEITTDRGYLPIYADVEPADASNRNVDWSIPYGDEIATINSSGILEATGNGAVIVRATAADGSGVYGEITINISGQIVAVSEVKVYGLNDEAAIETSGGSLQMIAEVLPVGVANRSVTWAIVQGQDLAHITQNGWLTAVGNGFVTVRATSNADPSRYGMAMIRITNQPVPAEEIRVAGTGNATSIDAHRGSLQMVAEVLPADTTITDVKWSVTDGFACATVSPTGLLMATGQSNGSVTVRADATDGSGVFGEAVIAVRGQDVPIDRIFVEGENGVSSISTSGGSLQIVATVYPAGVQDESVHWSVSDDRLASVDANGLLTAHRNGVVVVRAISNMQPEIYGETTITISGQPIPVAEIRVTGAGNASEISVSGGTLQMQAEVFPTNAANQDVVWSVVSGNQFASITNTGVLVASGTGNGPVQVRATAADGSGIFGETTIFIQRQIVYNLTVTAGSGGIISIGSSGQYEPGEPVVITAVPSGGSYRFSGWDSSHGGYFANDKSLSTTFIMPYNDTTVTASFTYHSSGGSGGGGSSSGGGGGGGSRSTGDTFSTQSSNSTKWYDSSDIQKLADSASSNGQNYVRTSGSNAAGISRSALRELGSLKYYHDYTQNGAVLLRITIPNPSASDKDLLLTGSTSGNAVDRTKSIFNQHFQNKVAVLHLEQTGNWGQTVKISAKLNLTGMDADNLVLYSYDKPSNSYKRISDPDYRIDANGYLQFHTPYAGEIIVSEGALNKK